jgi:hypothetical protein
MHIVVEMVPDLLYLGGKDLNNSREKKTYKHSKLNLPVEIVGSGDSTAEYPSTLTLHCPAC